MSRQAQVRGTSPVWSVAGRAELAHTAAMFRYLLVLPAAALLGIIGCEGSHDDSTLPATDSGTFTSDGGGPTDGAAGDSASADGAAPDADGGAAPSFTLSLGYVQSCALFDDGVAKCWGSVNVGGGAKKYGNVPGTMGANLPALDFGAGVKVKKLSTGRNDACAVLDSGDVKCFGINVYGQLGYTGNGSLVATTAKVDLGAGRTAKDVSVNTTHGCAILDDDTVKCWGDMFELGQGLATGSSTLALAVDLGAGRTAKAIVVELGFTCALLDDGRVKCWGRNGNGGDVSTAGGQLGTGDLIARGNDPGEMGDALLPVDLGIDPATTAPWKVKSLSTGDLRVCALLANDRIKCWGRNDSGVEGTGNVISYGSTGALVGDAIPFLDLGIDPATTEPWKVKSLATGNSGSCAVLANDRVKCWGTNEYGTLGTGILKGLPGTLIGDQAAEMGDALPFVDLGTDTSTGKPWVVKAIAMGEFQACAVLAGDRVKCWGYNANGMLGIGDANDRGAMPGQMGDALPLVLIR